MGGRINAAAAGPARPAPGRGAGAGRAAVQDADSAAGPRARQRGRRGGRARRLRRGHGRGRAGERAAGRAQPLRGGAAHLQRARLPGGERAAAAAAAHAPRAGAGGLQVGPSGGREPGARCPGARKLHPPRHGEPLTPDTSLLPFKSHCPGRASPGSALLTPLRAPSLLADRAVTATAPQI